MIRLPRFAALACTLRREWPLACGVVGLLLLILLHASASEDSYITFRVVDNLVEGYGLRWNVDERVQVYTNPLWLFLHVPFYALTHNIFAVTIGLSLACALGSLWLTLNTFRRPWPSALAFFFMPLALSQSFIDDSTTGLENALTVLLFAWFGRTLLRQDAPRFWLRFSLACSLCLVNRLDVAVFLFPSILLVVAKHWRTMRIGECLLGSLPIVAWESFAFLYYGFFFPNTRYAKLDPTIAHSEYLEHGYNYLFNFIAVEPVSALVTGVAVIGLPIMAWRRRAVPAEMIAVAMGILFYTVYIVSVGGSYISGRFWSLPAFAAIWVFYGQFSPRTMTPKLAHAAAALAWLQVVYPTPSQLMLNCPSCFAGRIHPYGLNLSVLGLMTGMDTLPEPARDTTPQVLMSSAIGFRGFEMGPTVHIVDTKALGDPLLARLPSFEGTISRIGHLSRPVPIGYLRAIAHNEFYYMDPDLAAYYRKLVIITRAPIFDKERLETVIAFNLGKYDGLLTNYLTHYKRLQADNS